MAAVRTGGAAAWVTVSLAPGLDCVQSQVRRLDPEEGVDVVDLGESFGLLASSSASSQGWRSAGLITHHDDASGR
jgi:hypothetical protein